MHTRDVLARLLLILSFLQTPAENTAVPTARTGTDSASQRDTGTILSADPLIHDTTVSDSGIKPAQEKPKKKSGIRDTISYEAEEIDYDIENKILYLRNDAVIRYQDMTLFADSITYIIEDNLFEAHGAPQLIEGRDTTVGEHMVYNIETRRGSVKYASTHMDEAYFNGQRIVKTDENVFYASDGDYTTCAYVDSPHYCFYAKDIKVIPNDKTIARPAIFNIADVPVAALPYFLFPINRNRSSGILTPAFGGHPGSGGYLDNVGYYWAPNDYADFLLAGKIQEFQDFVIRGQTRYALKYRLSGNISGRYTFSDNFEQRDQQWSLNYNHRQILTPDETFILSGGGRMVSSSNFYQDYSEEEREILEKNINANLSLSKRFKKINASAAATWSRTHNLVTEAINEDIPSVNFSLSDRPLIPEKTDARQPENDEEYEPRWYNKVYYGYNAKGIRKHVSQPDAPAEQEYTRSGAEQRVTLSYNHKIFKWLNLRPNFSVRMYALDAYKDTLPDDTVYTADTTFDTLEFLPDTVSMMDFIDTLVREDETGIFDTTFRTVQSVRIDSTVVYNRTDEWSGDYSWNAGVSLNTTLYGHFPVKLFNFAGIRHTMRPSISYSYRPEGNELDRTYYPIGISTPGSQKRSQAMSFSINNDFHGKTVQKPAEDDGEPVENKFHMFNVNISSGYNFEAAKRKFSDLSLSASTSNKLVNVNFSSGFWLYDENDDLSYPLLRSYRVRLSPRLNLSASGTFWGGDKIVFEGLAPDDPVEYRNAGQQKWTVGIGPNYTYSKSRTGPTKPFTTTKVYQLNANAKTNFTRIWSVSWNGGYDFKRNRMTSGYLNFDCDLECWYMKFRWGPPGSIDPGFYFIIQIRKVPEIKWEKRD
ncbi:MAG: hypothetical protein GF350_08220 [Chitinivibrionales bacterium]|nr:hypothetical protein [Chitinivibrionales bacterium]